jgi:hypothetical protein
VPEEDDNRLELKAGPELRADCANCFGLCCVAPGFEASADFAISKKPGRPCLNLLADFRCGIHSELPARGFAGCTVYDCFGAGQKVSQVTFGGRDWRQEDPNISQQMFGVFAVMRDLHELMWYLAEALTLRPARPLRAALEEALEQTSSLTHQGPAELVRLDVSARRQKVGALLRQAGELVRAAVLDAFLEDPAASRQEAELTRTTGLPGAALNPILRRLERAGWITGQGEDKGAAAPGPAVGPCYLLTSKGADLAKLEVAATARYARSGGQN